MNTPSLQTAKTLPENIHLIITSAESFPKLTARLVGEKINELQIELQRNVNIVFATGNTMIGFLENLANENIDWQRINAFHLDEYKGLETSNPHSFAYFLNKNIFSKVNLKQENIFYINGAQPNLPRYMENLKMLGGADIIILGIGSDGHLAFNEPPIYSQFDSRIQEVKLSESTLVANELDYPQIRQSPYAYTMGMADIFDGKNIFFFANKEKKAEIVKKALLEPITEDVPASILQKHPKVTAVIDQAAASLIPE
jgi:glucosamine-6-phosphate deaminase